MATERTPKTDAERIAELESEGLTHSDAVGVVMAEEMIAEQEAKKRAARKPRQRRTPAEKVAEGKAKPKATKTKEQVERAACLCGCGETPKGKKARYLPGHDARHHAALKAAGKKVTHLLPAADRAKLAERSRAKRATARSETEE